MHEVSVQQFRGGRLAMRIDAAEASWDGRRWVFSSGYVRTFRGDQERARAFDREAFDAIAEPPDNFARESRQPDQMNYFELRALVVKLRASGSRVANYLVDLHMKLAFPLINFIVIAAQRMHEEFGPRISLSDDALATDKQDALQTLRTLSEHITRSLAAVDEH